VEDVTPPPVGSGAGNSASPPANPPRRLTRAFVLAALVLALGVGVYGFVQDLDKSSTAKGMGSFCNSVGLVMQLAYERQGGLSTLHKLVDKQAAAVGGRVLSDTRAFELALSRHDTSTAQKYLLRLDGLCNSDGSPISTPLTTSPSRAK
jgi:hypothetical protein